MEVKVKEKEKERGCYPLFSSADDFTLNGASHSPFSDYSKVQKSLQEEVTSQFAPKRKQVDKLSRIYKALGLPGRAARVGDCGTFLEYHVTSEKAKLHLANFCKDRLCPMCNWRRSLKIFGQVSKVMDVLEPSGYQFIFLTLTVRNCDPEELPATVSMLFDGYRKLFHDCKRVKKAVCGCFRSLEITRNPLTGQYHPHIHVISAVLSDYWHKSFISQRDWSKLWRSCCDLDYDPVIDVRRIQPDEDKGLSGAVAEVSKYAVKSSDYLNSSAASSYSTVRDYLRSISGRRLCSFSGCFAQARKALALDDVEKGDLVQVDGDQLRSDVACAIVRYCWRAGVYVLDSVELPVDEPAEGGFCE